MMHISCYNWRSVQNGIYVTLPDGSSMRSTHTLMISILLLTKSARRAHLFPDLSSGDQIYIGKLCGDGFQTIFDKDFVTIGKNGIIILEV